MKNVLVYPCGTEIALEFYRAMAYSTHYSIIGGVDSYDHGRFVFENVIEGLPFITDKSTKEDIMEFQHKIEPYDIDLIYPAMDGVIKKFSDYREYLKPILCICNKETNELTRSKGKTYLALEKYIHVPKTYENIESVKEEDFPVFVKPDVGQGAVGAKKINSKKELVNFFDGNDKKYVICEFLPGEEYTVDCLTNKSGKLIFSQARARKRIKDGISVNSISIDDTQLTTIAQTINSHVSFKGAWFFQVRKNNQGEYVLMEIASRIAGASSYTRAMGVNLPELTLEIFSGSDIDFVLPNDYTVEQDRALYNAYDSNISFSKVYMDYDDTVTCRGKLNDRIIQFIAKCKNHKIPVILLSRHDGDLNTELSNWGITGLFDKVVHMDRKKPKSDFISDKNSIFIDDSFGERKQVKEAVGIPTFEPSMVEFLINRRGF